MNIWIYNHLLKKRRKASLRIPTQNRDRRKTEIATFVNFIHQKDAYIVMFMIILMHLYDENAPIYTVHDNFITTAKYAQVLPWKYKEVFQNDPIPLKEILINLIPKSVSKKERKEKFGPNVSR